MNDPDSNPPSGLLDRVEGWPLTALVGFLGIAMLATWAPHYLAWPWWPDLDAYATLAQGWDRGVKPYRDAVVLNFPGQIEVFWVLGKCFGWGRTAPMYALDLGLLLGLGGMLMLWSRRRFGRALPGLVGFAAVLAHYAGQDFRHVAQRDWQGPLLAVAGLLALQGWNDRRGRIASAVLFAAAFTIRPHVVLFLPILLGILCEDGRPSWRALLEWAGVFGLGLIACFSPLLLQGLLGDFVRGIRIAGYDRDYSKASFWTIVAILREEVRIKRIAASLALNLIALALAPRDSRRTFAPWAGLFVMALFYRPIHPRGHLYLDLPLWLAWAVNLAGLVGVSSGTLNRPMGRLVAFGLALVLAIPGVPRFCRVDASLAVLMPMREGHASNVPPGAEAFFRPTKPRAPYSWDDYTQVLAYLRRSTNEGTPVANFFRNPPFPPVNGPVGRVSPWPAESGTIWIWAVDPSLEPRFVESLEKARGAVVVWVPGEVIDEPRRNLGRLAGAVKKTCRFEAKFGEIEVWRRAD